VTIQLLSYDNSILNPLLKILIIILFAIGTWYFYRAGKQFGGNLRNIARLLMWGGIFGCIAALFRLLGDYNIQDKWVESASGLLFAIISFAVAYFVYTKFDEINKAFGLTEEK
jgi:cbb3-type cytochrome oxidase subunit 3